MKSRESISTSPNGTEKATNRAQYTPETVEGGDVLFDCDGRMLALDEGAAAILNVPSADSSEEVQLPRPILDVLRAGEFRSGRSERFRIDVQGRQYTCRINVAYSRTGGFPDRITVLHLQRDLNIDDALLQISSEYRLTIREHQALRGVLLGLSSKEVAKQMQISPNTVKAFLRLIMGKMGVHSRSEIVAKFFEPQHLAAASPFETRPEQAVSGPDLPERRRNQFPSATRLTLESASATGAA